MHCASKQSSAHFHQCDCAQNPKIERKVPQKVFHLLKKKERIGAQCLETAAAPKPQIPRPTLGSWSPDMKVEENKQNLQNGCDHENFDMIFLEIIPKPPLKVS